MRAGRPAPQSRHPAATVLGVALVAAAVVAARPIVAAADVPSPSIEGPVSGGLGAPFVAATSFDLAQVGYEQAEYFIAGTASAFASATPLTKDGLWTASPGDTAPYKTRILVYRPILPARFNGTVFVEWLNVSGGVDAAPDWTGAHTELIREGCAWVGVSAQYVGVEGGGGLLGVVDMGLKTVDPIRYGTLSHPGDSFSYDIFSQAGEAVRDPLGPDPLGGLHVQRVIAVGESQSAFRLTTYVDAVHPLARVYDGFLIHSRGGGSVYGAPLSESPQTAIPVPLPTFIRADLDVPVLTFETETDLTFLLFARARQADDDHFRLWEVAGTAHADTYLLVTGPTDLGRSPDAANLVVTTDPVPGLVTCDVPINSGPQHFVLDAAFAALGRWVRGGTPPPMAPRLATTGTGATLAITRDAHGNAVGGIRTPEVDVPIATFTGVQSGSILCALFGTTTPFDAITLATLYPTHLTYLAGFDRATTSAVRAGFVVRRDARLLRLSAARSLIGH